MKLKLADTTDMLPCRDCITLPMCYQRVRQELDKYNENENNPYTINMISKQSVIINILTAKCSIVNNLIYKVVRDIDEKIWGMKVSTRNQNHQQSLYKFFVPKEEQNDPHPPL